MPNLIIPFSKFDFRLWFAVIIFLIALFLRLSYQNGAIVNTPIMKDAREYYLTSYNLFHYGVYSIEQVKDSNAKPRTIWRRTPGYPLFLYPFFLVSKTPNAFIINVTLAQACLGSLTCVLTFLIGLPFLSRFWAFIAGLATALSPHLIAIDDFLLSESLFTFTIVLGTLIMVRSFQRQKLGLTLLSGIIYSFSSLVRSVSGLLGPFMLLLFFAFPKYWNKEKRFQLIIPVLFFLIGFALINLPYRHIRNTIIANSVMVSKDSAWRHIVLGSDINLKNFIKNKIIPEFKNETKKMINNKPYGLSVLIKHFRETPLAYIKWYFGGKFLFMWKWDNIYIGDVYHYPMIKKGFHQDNWLTAVHKVMKWLHWPSFYLAIIGTVIFFSNWIRGNLKGAENLLFAPILIFLYFSIILTILVPLPRYAIPIRPFVYIIGCYPLMLVFRLFHQFLQKRLQ